MAWTEQQKNAIELRNSSVIVSAAAGSGKTAVLTERLAQLIADEKSGVRADRIIVVTFTNDAAAELRKRLDSKLRELLFKDPSNRHLLRQQTLLQSAKISTINSFCFELLRDNITDQGITSGFTVLDESENNVIKSQAMDELINYYSSEEYDKISYLYDKFCLKNDDKLVQVINLTDKYLSSEAMREKWMDRALKMLQDDPWKSIYYQKIASACCEKLARALKLAQQRLDMMEDIFDDTEKKNAVKYSQQAEEDILRVKKAIELFESDKRPDSEVIDFCQSFGRVVIIRRTDDINAEQLEFCNAKRKNVIQLVSESLRVFIDFEDNYAETRTVTEILTEMMKKYHEFIWKRKCEKNAISFDDGERLVLELLAQEDENGAIIQSEAAIRISDYYDVIMIDEYQDSNNKQDLIFKLISKNYRLDGKGEPVYGSNAFVVGDVKQSIYRFRLANPQNFISTLEHSQRYPGVDSDNYSILLNKNFRSSHGVIEYVNFVFSQLMTKNCGDIDYNEDEQLYFGAEEFDAAAEKIDCATSLQLIDFSDTANENGTDSDDDISPDVEAVCTASRIARMIADRVPVVMKNGETRPCQASDFCILIRKNKYTKTYINELANLGIDAKGEEEKGYLSSREIAILIDLLRIIDNPLLDIPMAAVMMSPMYMFEFEEIAFLKAIDQEQNLYTIINTISEGDPLQETNILLAERCSSFLKSINSFRLAAVTMTVSELIARIYDSTDFISVMQLYTDGDKKRANLRALIQYAKNYESSTSYEGSAGLSGFIRYIDRIIETGADFSQGKISSASGSYVAVKTIHKSKGLEYPFVFLAETATKFKMDNNMILCSGDSRIGYTLYNQKLLRKYRTLTYNNINEQNTKDTLSEEMRLLYVALTRAKQKLFINLTYNDKRIAEIEKLLELYQLENGDMSVISQNAKNHADWLWMALFRHSEFPEISKKIGLDQKLPHPEIIYREDCFRADYLNRNDTSSIAKNNNEASNTLPSIALYEQMRDIINFSYDKTLSETPAKLSVTQITKKLSNKSDSFDFKLKRPKFTEETTSLTGAERGTAIHTFFQYCDFEAARSEPSAEIQRMVSKGFLSQPEADSIDLVNVAAFFDSNLFRRITESPVIYREKKFMIAVSDINIDHELIHAFKKTDGMLKGIIDLAFEEDNRLVIVDYKSDRGVSPVKLKERYEMQIRLYKAALELTTGKPVSEGYLYSFELQREIRIEF